MRVHSAGPWKYVSGQVVRASDGAVIANMDRSEAASKAGIYPVERDANARLIAQAPAFEEMVRLYLDCSYVMNDEEAEAFHEQHGFYPTPAEFGDQFAAILAEVQA